jgi:hypothetical protein
MSSLLQFQGKVVKKGVLLEFYLATHHKWINANGQECTGALTEATEDISCPQCGKKHPQLYVAWRKPAGMFGHFVVFRYLGEEQVPDLSIPIAVERVPRGARKLTSEENAKHWHRS